MDKKPKSDGDLETQRSITAELAKQVKLKRELASAAQAMSDSEEDIVDYAKQYLDNLNASKAIQADIDKLTAERAKQDEIQDLFAKKLTAEEIKHKKTLEQALEIQITQANNLKKQINAELNKVDLSEQGIAKKKEELELAKKQQKFAEKYSDEIEKQLGFLDSIDDAIKEIPVVGGVLSKALGLDDIKKELSEKIAKDFAKGMTTAGTAGAGAFKTLITMARSFTAVLLANPIFLLAAVVVTIIAVFKKMVDIAFEMDKHTTEIANNLNISKHAAHDLEDEMEKNRVSIEKVVHFSEILGKQFGEYGAIIAKDVIPRMNQMQMNLQLSDEEMGNIAEAAMLVGSSLRGTITEASDFETTALNVTKQFYEQRGIQLNNAELQDEYRKNLQAIGKIEKNNLALYGKSEQALVNQVMTVRKLGLEFDQVTKIMDATLDIETSVTNEMEANVLLGKNLNLNAVRYASLYGSVEDVARETVKSLEDQNINLDTFNDMTGFQKKQLEKVYGLSAAEIQNMLLKNKIQDKTLLTAIKERKITADELVAQSDLTKEQAQQLITEESKASMAEVYEDIQAQLSSTIKGNLLGIQSLIKVLSDFGHRAAKVGLVRAMAGGGESLAETQAKEALASGKQITKDMADEATEGADTGAGTYAAAATTGAAIGAGLTAWLGPGAGIGAGVGALVGLAAAGIKDAIGDTEYQETPAKTQNDFISRPGQAPISFNKDDIIIGATNPFGGESTGPAGPDPQMGEMIALLKQLVASTSGPTVIKIGSRTIEELDSQIGLRKNYNTVVDSSYGNRI